MITGDGMLDYECWVGLGIPSFDRFWMWILVERKSGGGRVERSEMSGCSRSTVILSDLRPHPPL